MGWAIAATAVAFVSTLMGGTAALRWPGRRELLMALAGGVVLAAALFDLLPDAMHRAGEIGMPAAVPVGCMLLGFAFFSALERLAHRHGEGRAAGAAGALGFVVHSFFDGLAIGLGFRVDSALGVLVAVAVIGHDFSDGLNTVSYLLAHAQSARRSRRWLVADALAPICGALAVSLAPVPDAVFPVALGFFCGLFLYAATTNLLPRARAVPAMHALPVALAGAVAMFLITRLA